LIPKYSFKLYFISVFVKLGILEALLILYGLNSLERMERVLIDKDLQTQKLDIKWMIMDHSLQLSFMVKFMRKHFPVPPRSHKSHEHGTITAHHDLLRLRNMQTSHYRNIIKILPPFKFFYFLFWAQNEKLHLPTL
jgi:hypothetical protein